jgi:hypothetical protein
VDIFKRREALGEVVEAAAIMELVGRMAFVRCSVPSMRQLWQVGRMPGGCSTTAQR